MSHIGAAPRSRRSEDDRRVRQAGRRSHQPAQSLSAHLRRHARLVEARLERVALGAAARALRAHRGGARDGRRTTKASRSRRSSRASRRAARRRATSCARSASPRPRSTASSTRCRVATSSRTGRARSRATRARSSRYTEERGVVDGGARDARRLLGVDRLSRATCTASTGAWRGRSRRAASTSSASNVYTTRSGLALEVYRVATPPGGAEDRERTVGGLRGEPARGAGRAACASRTWSKRRRRPIGATATPSRNAAQR